MANDAPRAVWTVGHSNHSFEHLAALLRDQRIDTVIDVRSYPYSRYAPQFNREELAPALTDAGIAYYFQGESLGGRPDAENEYDAEGHALYGRMAERPQFRAAIERIFGGAGDHRIALLCAEAQPGECHRRLLVGRVLCGRGAELRHILRDGSIEVEAEVKLPGEDEQTALFGEAAQWRSSQSVSRRRRLSASSAA